VGFESFGERPPRRLSGHPRREPAPHELSEDPAMGGFDGDAAETVRLPVGQLEGPSLFVLRAFERPIRGVLSDPLLPEGRADGSITGRSPRRLILHQLAREPLIVHETDALQVRQGHIDLIGIESGSRKADAELFAAAPANPQEPERPILRRPLRLAALRPALRPARSGRGTMSPRPPELLRPG
jgi:hypothetical protein